MCFEVIDDRFDQAVAQRLASCGVVGRRDGLCRVIVSATERAEAISFEAFRTEVFDVVFRRVPGLPLTTGEDAEEVTSGEFRFYLSNLYRLVRTLPTAEREDEIFKWFSEMAKRKATPAASTPTWTVAKPLLRPKLAPVTMPEQTTNLVCRPFSAGLVICYGVDLGASDMYVLDRHLAAWGVSLDEVHDAAIANLEALSAVPLQLASVPGHDGGYMDIALGDAYDAARILLPTFRKRLITSLGPTLLAGIPTRDVFLVWTKGFVAHAGFIEQIREDVATRPHVLTDKVFVLTADGVWVATDDELT